MQETLQNFILSIEPWLRASGIKIVAILVGAFLIRKFGKLIIGKIIRKLVPPEQFLSAEAEKKREDTLIGVFSGTVEVLVWIVALMMILSEFGIDIAPVMAAAGVVGLALGFGGQYLIRDVIAGLFIIIENQYRVGDAVEIDTVSGTIEDITLRTTILRDLNGTVHHIQNGSFSRSANKSKEFARINLDVGVAYDSDMKTVIGTINTVGKEMASHSKWGKLITKKPKFERVNEFADSAIIVKILGETKPLEQWAVTGELRKRLKAAFDKEGIEFPFPQMVVHKAKE
ncbi:MAG: mechanosensitive ion channel family protein [Patescibacteria group bacterium]|nr:mechanosensitive ion channel family protein [Patescibacteria group bacterium]